MDYRLRFREKNATPLARNRHAAPPAPKMLQRPDRRLAERPEEPGSVLLQHEFFEVIVKVDGRAAEAQVYQAMEFGENDDNLVMVKGMYYAPARVVLGCRRLRDNAHTHDADEGSSDADVALREDAPELVQVTNCTAWFDVGALTDGKPMVVHPRDVKERGVFIAGKAQHYVCGSKAMEMAPGLNHAGFVGFHPLGEAGFDITPLARNELVSFPELRLGQEYESVTGMWGGVDDIFARARMALRDGNGVRSGSFEMPWTYAEWRFWNQVSDTKPDDWARSTVSVMDRRFDAAFNYQQLHRDVSRAEVTYKSKQDFRRLQMVSGLFGLVGVSAQTEQGGQNIARFRTGTNLRVCTSDVSFQGAPEKGPGRVLAEAHWKSRGGEHGSFRMRYDKQEGKRHGTLTVRMVWHEITHRDVEGFEDKCLIV